MDQPGLVRAPSPTMTVGRQGQYAGLVSRLVAFAIDLAALWGIYSLTTYAVSLADQLFTGKSLSLSHHQVLAGIVLAAWWFLYFSYQWATGGRTIGMALLGLRVVQKDGQAVRARQAMIRTAALYLSFVFFFVAVPWMMVQRQRRAPQDLLAGTVVVYSWDAKAARLRWLADRRGDEEVHPTT